MSRDKNDAVLFDLDGVLVDSRAAISGAINHALDAHGLREHPSASLHRFIGPPLNTAFAELTGQPVDSALVLSCIESYRVRYATASLRDFFEVIGAPDCNAHSEDKTATIRGALSALKAGRAVMVGDRSFDIIGAHACAIPAIGVSWGIGSAEELEASGAEMVVDEPSQLPGAVSSLPAP